MMKNFNVFILLFSALISLNSCKGPELCCGSKPKITIDTECFKILDNTHDYAVSANGVSANLEASADKAIALAKNDLMIKVILDYQDALKNYTNDLQDNDSLKTLLNSYISKAAQMYFSRNDALACKKSEKLENSKYRTLIVMEFPKDSVFMLTRHQIIADTLLTENERNYRLKLLEKK